MCIAHEMILNGLSAKNLDRVLRNEEFLVMYAWDNSKALIVGCDLIPNRVTQLIELESVRALRAKDEKEEPITVAELDKCLWDIKQRNHLAGRVLMDGSAELKRILTGQQPEVKLPARNEDFRAAQKPTTSVEVRAPSPAVAQKDNQSHHGEPMPALPVDDEFARMRRLYIKRGMIKPNL